MTSRESSRQPSRSINSTAQQNHGSPSLDVGQFVDKVHNLIELLYPLRVVGDAVLYVFRWQNYLLTLSVLLVLSVLLYHPSLFLSFITVLAIALMAVGKYYSQTKALSQLKKREHPSVDLLDQDAQHFRRLHKDQKKAHKALVEYTQIILHIDKIVVKTSNFLDYFYKIILWRSPEVSLCVTVLLCVGLVLLCTIYLKAIVSCLPLVILCFNGYFLKRTVECLKNGCSYIYSMFRWKRQRSASGNPAAAASTSTTATAASGTEEDRVDATDQASQSRLSELDRNHNAAASGSGAAGARDASAVNSNSTSDSEEHRSRTESIRSFGASATESPSGEKLPQTASKGFCSKCNASFAKLLKRKHDCNYCGQSFCGSCTVKVKRALLGATSPAAFEESVRVCQDCKTKLDTLGKRTSVSSTVSPQS